MKKNCLPLFVLVTAGLAPGSWGASALGITQNLMALTALLLAWLTFQERIELWHIYLLTAVQAMAVAFDTPSRQALIPNLVPGRELPNAFSLNSIGFQTGAIIGPALSGLVIAYVGQASVYLINAVSYGAVIAALLLMGKVTQTADSLKHPEVSLSAIRDGVRFILRSPMILSTMLLDFFATFFSSANTLMPVYVRDVLNVGVIEYGWLSAAQAIGATLAALVTSQMDEIRHQGRIFLSAVVAFGLATIIFGLARSLPLAMIALIAIGASDSVSMIIRNTIRQLQTPDHLRGRMVSVNQIFFMGGPQLGEVEAGVVAQIFGPVFAIVSGGVGCLLAVGWVARRWPQLLRYNGDEPALAGSMAD